MILYLDSEVGVQFLLFYHCLEWLLFTAAACFITSFRRTTLRKSMMPEFLFLYNWLMISDASLSQINLNFEGLFVYRGQAFWRMLPFLKIKLNFWRTFLSLVVKHSREVMLIFLPFVCSIIYELQKFPVFCCSVFPFGQPLRQNPAVIFIAFGREGWVWIVNEFNR